MSKTSNPSFRSILRIPLPLIGVSPKGGQDGYPVVEKDEAKAFQWFTKAMEDGYVPAMVELGKMYFCGQFIEKDHEVARELFQKALDQGHDSSSVQWYLKQISNGSTTGSVGAMSPKQVNATTTRIISNKPHVLDATDKEPLKQDPILEQFTTTSTQETTITTQKKIELLEEQLRLQSLEVERLIRMSSPVNYLPSASQGGLATRVEPFHFVVPSPTLGSNKNTSTTMISGDNTHQPVYSVQPQYEFNYRTTANNVKVESHKLLNINDDLGPSSTKTAYVMRPEQVDLISDQPISPTQPLPPPLIRDIRVTTSSMSIFEELGLISFEEDVVTINTKPDIKDDTRVFIMTNKPNEMTTHSTSISYKNNKPHSIQMTCVLEAVTVIRLLQKKQSAPHDYLIETFVRKASIRRTVESDTAKNSKQ